MPENMDHNEFDFYEDLVTPFSAFLKRLSEFKRHPHSKLEERVEEEKKGEEVAHSDESDSGDHVIEANSIELAFEPWLYNPPKMIFDLEKAMDEVVEAK